MLLLVGLPLFYMEMILGQYTGISCTKLYSRVSPGIRGLGYGMLSVPVIVAFQYVIVMAYGFYFLFSGFTSTLPWTYCDAGYNTEYCYSVKKAQTCDLKVETLYLNNCTSSYAFCELFPGFEFDPAEPQTCYNSTHHVPQYELHTRRSPSEEFWYYKVLEIDVDQNGVINTEVNSWTKWGEIRWELVGCLALCWVLICLSLIKGTASYGKVVYITTTFPYVVLTILLGYVATLDGFTYGLEFYFIPEDWSQLFKIEIWNEAASQIFFSLGLGVGTQLLISSYNQFDSNCFRDSLLVAFFNSFTSLFAGTVVFGCLGFIAEQKGVGIENVIDSGPGLAFIVFPEAVSAMEVSPLFSFLFFIMLIMLAISTVTGLVESLVAAFLDEMKHLRKYRIFIVIGASIIGFLGGISMCFDSGYLMFNLIDSRLSRAMLILALIELVTIAWFYGADKIMNHVEEMGMRLPAVVKWYWLICWVLITPALLLIVIVIAWIGFSGDSLLGYTYPGWASALGWGIELLPEAIIIAVSAYTTIKRYRAGKPVAFLRTGPQMKPNSKWGPRPDRPGAPQVGAGGGATNEGYSSN